MTAMHSTLMMCQAWREVGSGSHNLLPLTQLGCKSPVFSIFDTKQAVLAPPDIGQEILQRKLHSDYSAVNRGSKINQKII